MYNEMQEFFGSLLVDYFTSIDDSYSYNLFIDGDNRDVNDVMKRMKIKAEVVQHEHSYSIVKFNRADITIYLKFNKYENSREKPSYVNDIKMVEQKEKIVYYFE